MLIEKESLGILHEAIRLLEQGFQELPEFSHVVDTDALSKILSEVAKKMQDNYPYPHPLYIGQMMKPEHLDWIGHIWQVLNRAAYTVLNK